MIICDPVSQVLTEPEELDIEIHGCRLPDALPAVVQSIRDECITVIYDDGHGWSQPQGGTELPSTWQTASISAWPPTQPDGFLVALRSEDLVQIRSNGGWYDACVEEAVAPDGTVKVRDHAQIFWLITHHAPLPLAPVASHALIFRPARLIVPVATQDRGLN